MYLKSNSKQNILLYNLFFLILSYFLFFVLFKASISEIIFPFAFGFLFAITWCLNKPILLCSSYLLAGITVNFNITALLINFITCAVLLLFYLIHKKTQREVKQWLLISYGFLSQIGYIVFNYIANVEMLNIFLTILIGLLFMLASSYFLSAVIKNRVVKLTLDQQICGFVILLVLSSGLSGISFFNIEMVKVVSVFFMLFFTYLFGATGVISGAVMGLGVALSTGNTSFIASFTILGLFAVCFQNKSRYFSCFAILLADVVNGLYLKLVSEYSFFSILSVAFGVILFLLVSQTTLDLIKKLYNTSSSTITTRNIVNRSREGICKRMHQLSEVFFEMDNNFKKMIKGVLPEQDAKQMVFKEVVEKVCGDCEHRNRCFRTLSEETQSVFNNILESGFKRGKVSILDVPNSLSTRCVKMNTLLISINQLLTSYKQYATMVNNADTSKFLLGEQMGGVGKLLKNLAEETNKNVTFDTNLENEIIDEMKYFNIACHEAIVYEQSGKDIFISLLLNNGNNFDKVEKCVSKVLKHKMIVAETNILDNTDLIIVNLKSAPHYDVIYGCSGSSKLGSEVSGDTYSFVKINENKVLMAICDGMGSGKNAQRTSEQAINMIENFYKAGFDNEVVLNSANKLLTLNNEDVFSALDICIIDLKDGACDFIKVGGTEGLVVSENNLILIPTGSLPIGILEEIKPNITKSILKDKDIVLMFSDGVADNFGGVEKIKEFVLTLKTTNPQTICDEILNEVLKITKNNLSDDCTILATRFFARH